MFAAAVGRLSIRAGSAALRSLQTGRVVSARTIGGEIRIGNFALYSCASRPIVPGATIREEAGAAFFFRPAAAAPTGYPGAKTTARS
jgi:hypothetical protein